MRENDFNELKLSDKLFLNICLDGEKMKGGYKENEFNTNKTRNN